MRRLTTTKDMGLIVQRLRKTAQLSQNQLADLAGLSRTAIQGIEAGKQTLQLDTLLSVLQVLNIKVYLDHPLLPDEGTNNEDASH